MKNPIENKLHEIADAIFGAMQQKKLLLDDLGLFSGRMGIVIFCEHYLHAYPDPRRTEILDDYLDSFFDRLTSGMTMLTYCSGLTGVLEGLRYLNREKLLEVDYSDIENNYRKSLYEFVDSNLAHNNYDYLHGALGTVKYFHDDPVLVNRVLELLGRTAEKDGVGYKWKSRLGMEEKYGYNIALSHGISSIVAVLCGLTTSGTDLKKRDEIIIEACDYILSQQIDPRKYGCFFPSQSLENEPEREPTCSRLAWCYGDLGVAASLWQAGKTLHNESWRAKAIEVFIHSAGRRSTEETMAVDAGLCHGTAGIAMMYHYMYLQTGELLFLETRDYWVESSLKRAAFDDGPAGYNAWHGNEESWVAEYSILEGVAGIGLLFLDTLDRNTRDDGWMNFFLLA